MEARRLARTPSGEFGLLPEIEGREIGLVKPMLRLPSFPPEETVIFTGDEEEEEGDEAFFTIVAIYRERYF